MKTSTILLIPCLLLIQCNSPEKNNQKTNVVSVDTPTKKISSLGNKIEEGDYPSTNSSTDTIIHYSINGMSSDGSEVEAHYVKGSLQSSRWKIFGESGQVRIDYKFFGDSIKVIEKTYTYKTSLEQVNGESDMRLVSVLRFTMDTNGVITTKLDRRDFVNVFSDFKSVIPLRLINRLPK